METMPRKPSPSWCSDKPPKYPPRVQIDRPVPPLGRRPPAPLPPPPPYTRDKIIGVRMIIVAFASCACVCAALVLAALAAAAFLNNSQPSSQNPSHLNVYEAQKHIIQDINDNHRSNDGSFMDPTYENQDNNYLEDNYNRGLDLNAKVHTNDRDTVYRYQNKKSHENTKLEPKNDQPIFRQTKTLEKKEKVDIENRYNIDLSNIPAFKPTLPDISQLNLPGSLTKSDDVDYWYDDDLLYDDYVQSNSLTNYILEKIQELYTWIKTDPELNEVKDSTHQLFEKGNPMNNSLSQLLVALNESIVESNVTIVMSKLKQLYYSDNNTVYANQPKRNLINSSTDLFTFGLLSLDVILLHNIQTMAWNNQVGLKEKMLQDPEVFAFNSLFMEKNAIESLRRDASGRYKEHKTISNKQHNEDEWWGTLAVESVLEIGLGTARAALHLAKAYRNAKSGITAANAFRGSGSSAALHRLRASYSNVPKPGNDFSQLDCIWYIYCKNLAATAALPAPFGTMAKINGFALRLASGSVPASRALETLMMEALTGFDQVHCKQLLPKCSTANAADLVMETVLLANKKES